MHSHPNARLTQKSRLRLVNQHLQDRRPLAELAAAPGFRKRTSTALHALASETPTAKSKAHGHTEFGEAGP